LTLYFESQNATEEFYIDNVTITMTAPAPDSDGGSDVIAIPEGEEVAAFTDFEDGTKQGWAARNGNEELTVTSDTVKNGSNSLLISNRQASFDSAKLDTLAEMYPGHTYNVSVWVKLATGVNRPNYKYLGGND
jgi:Carbohydrate binding domain